MAIVTRQTPTPLLQTCRVRDAPIFVQIAEEKTVYQGGLPKARLSQYHQGELEPPFNRFSVHLLGQRCESDIVPVLVNKTKPIKR